MGWIPNWDASQSGWITIGMHHNRDASQSGCITIHSKEEEEPLTTKEKLGEKGKESTDGGQLGGVISREP